MYNLIILYTMDNQNIPATDLSKEELEERARVKELIAKFKEQNYHVRNDSLLAYIPSRSKFRGNLKLSTYEHANVWATVVLVGEMAGGVLPGDEVLIDHNLPYNQITQVKIEGEEFWFLGWHECLVYKRPTNG